MVVLHNNDDNYDDGDGDDDDDDVWVITRYWLITSQYEIIMN